MYLTSSLGCLKGISSLIDPKTNSHHLPNQFLQGCLDSKHHSCPDKQVSKLEAICLTYLPTIWFLSPSLIFCLLNALKLSPCLHLCHPILVPATRLLLKQFSMSTGFRRFIPTWSQNNPNANVTVLKEPL